ncbi:MAG TPA: LytR family transcriptional regulator, partial [Lactococcus sp.]|nr:LytR family transcriptional regulator [Lactococcus sp.]
MAMNRSKKKQQKKKHPIRNAILITLGLLLVTGTAFAAFFYQTARVNIDKTYAPLETSKNQAEASRAISENKPLSFLIMGLDSRQEDLSGRTDSLMLVTVNPTTKQTTMVSIPRDTFIEAADGSITASNKINAAYVQGGAAASIAAVNQLLQLDIDHYVTMNFSGIEHLVDALGGITVNSDLDFKVDDMTFHKGENTLNGKEALAYVRMRHDDPRGTYGRD